MKWFQRENGQSMVEFALVLPILLLLLCGIIDFGWIYSNKIAAVNACREAARYSAIHVNDSNTNNDNADAAAVVSESAPYLSSLVVTLTYPDDESVEINVEATIPYLTGVTSTLFGNSGVTISSSCIMKIEQ